MNLTLGNLAGLLAIFLVALPVALYFLPARRTRMLAGRPDLWREAVAEAGRPASWEPLRRPAWLALQIVLVVLLAVAWSDPHAGLRRRVLVLDRSGSMRAAVGATTRWHEACDLARQYLDSGEPDDQWALVTAGDVPVVHLSFTSDRASLRRALGAVEPAAGGTQMAAALALARDLAGEEGAVVAVTDGSFARLPGKGRERFVRVGQPADNQAVTRLAARRSLAHPQAVQAFVEILRWADTPRAVHVTFTWNGRLLERRSVELTAGRAWCETFQFDSFDGGTLQASLETADAYPYDDALAVDVAEAPRLPVVLITAGSRLLESALRALPHVALSVVPSPPDPLPAGCVVVLDRPAESVLPDAPALVVAPHGDSVLWHLGPRVEEGAIDLLEAGSRRPASSLPPAMLPEARTVEPMPGFPSQVAARAGGAAAVGRSFDRPSGRVVVLTGQFETSGLAMEPGLTVWLGQTLWWLAGRRDPLGEGDTVSLASADLAESDLRCAVELPAAAPPCRAGWPPTAWLLVPAVALLLVEWRLYARRWIG